MSSTTTVTKSPKARPAASTIDTLNNDTAHIYSHIHPILILSLYAFQFKSIVADPVPALLNTLVPLSTLQIAYVSICLPATGASSAPPVVKPGFKKKPGASKPESSIQSKIVVRETILHTRIVFAELSIARLSVAPPLNCGRDASRRHYPHPLWRSADHPLPAYIPLRRPHFAASLNTSHIRAWCGWREMERDCGPPAAHR